MATLKSFCYARTLSQSPRPNTDQNTHIKKRPKGLWYEKHTYRPHTVGDNKLIHDYYQMKKKKTTKYYRQQLAFCDNTNKHFVPYRKQMVKL